MKIALIAATFALTMLAATAAELKIATIDMMRMVKNHPNYESNKTYLTGKEKDVQKRLEDIKQEGEDLQSEGRKLAEQYRNPMLNEKAKADLEKKITSLQQKLAQIEQRYRSEAVRSRQDLQDDEARLLKTTTEDLRKRINKYAKAAGYDLVLDKSAVPYAVDGFDITEKVLKSMGVEPKPETKAEDGKPAAKAEGAK